MVILILINVKIVTLTVNHAGEDQIPNVLVVVMVPSLIIIDV